jgi:hypothetical protein
MRLVPQNRFHDLNCDQASQSPGGREECREVLGVVGDLESVLQVVIIKAYVVTKA